MGEERRGEMEFQQLFHVRPQLFRTYRGGIVGFLYCESGGIANQFFRMPVRMEIRIQRPRNDIGRR